MKSESKFGVYLSNSLFSSLLILASYDSFLGLEKSKSSRLILFFSGVTSKIELGFISASSICFSISSNGSDGELFSLAGD